MRGYELDSKAGSAAVRQIAKMSITGNVIPMSWFDHLRYPSGKPHLNAIIILSDIVYWYRPVEVRDEQTGRWLEDRKKFEGEYLQRNRSSYAKQYGLTNKQAKDAFHFLESKGAIEIIIAKSMTTKDGRRLGNVPFIALNAEKIAEFNEPLVPVGPRLGTYKSEPLVPVGPTNTEIAFTETINTKEKHIHIENPNSGFSRAPEHPQAQQPTKRTTKRAPLSSQSALFESPPSVSVEPPPSQPQVPQQQRKPNAMYDAICLAWKTEGGMAGKIQQQLLGKMPKKHPHHASNFAEPATPDEVASFAKWYRNRYPGCDMPMSPEKIQHHFAAFRRETGEAAKKNAPKIREQNGRRLKYDSTLQSWLDIGPAQVPPQSFNRSQNEAYAQ